VSSASPSVLHDSFQLCPDRPGVRGRSARRAECPGGQRRRHEPAPVPCRRPSPPRPDRDLVRTPTRFPGAVTTDAGLVDRDNARELITVGAHHGPSHLVQPGPGRLLAAEPKLTLKSQGRTPVLLDVIIHTAANQVETGGWDRWKIVPAPRRDRGLALARRAHPQPPRGPPPTYFTQAEMQNTRSTLREPAGGSKRFRQELSSDRNTFHDSPFRRVSGAQRRAGTSAPHRDVSPAPRHPRRPRPPRAA